MHVDREFACVVLVLGPGCAASQLMHTLEGMILAVTSGDPGWSPACTLADGPVPSSSLLRYQVLHQLGHCNKYVIAWSRWHLIIAKHLPCTTVCLNDSVASTALLQPTVVGVGYMVKTHCLATVNRATYAIAVVSEEPCSASASQHWCS